MTDIVVDTSAIVELMIEGPHANTVRETLTAGAVVYVTSVARVEAAFVMMGRFGWDRATFDRSWQAMVLHEIPVDAAIAVLAVDAYELWGKGRSKAALNFGDCFSHALAVARGLPLLFVGDDFSQTGLPKA